MAKTTPILITDDVKARFWAKVDIRGEDECWPWTASKNKAGYGQMTVSGRSVRAHRIALTIKQGSIPDGYCACHHCDNPECVNPAHLFPGTVAENNKDKTAKGRNVRPKRDESLIPYARGERASLAKLTSDAVRAIRAQRQAGMQLKDIAAIWGVDKSNVCLIVKRRTWRHV